VNLRKDHSCIALFLYAFPSIAGVFDGFLALEVSGAVPKKDAVKRDIQPESQNCGWSGV